MRRRERRAARLAYVAGLIILLGGGTGSAGVYLLLLDLAAREAPLLAPLLLFAVVALPVVAAFGGVTVMTGAFLVLDGRRGTGQILLEIGSGMGVLGIVAAVGSSLAGGERGVTAAAGALAGLAGIGVVLSLVARGMLVSAAVERGVRRYRER